MRLDLEEAAMMLKKDIFIINAILNEKKEIHAFVSGHPVAAHRRGIKISESISARKIDHPADIAIVASNPMNADLRQGIKAVANIEKSVKENGLIIAFLECKNGLGDIAVPHKWLGLDNTLLRAILKLVGKKRLLWLTDIVKKNTGVEERFLTHFSMQVARKNRLFIYSNNLSGGTGKRLGLFRQFSDIDKMLKSASRYTPKNPTVYVYPYGGVTYPIR